MQKGTVVELTDRSSGFIKRVGIKENLFFHSDDFVGSDFKQLKKGAKVSFAVTETTKGPYAVRVTKI